MLSLMRGFARPVARVAYVTVQIIVGAVGGGGEGEGKRVYKRCHNLCPVWC
jgi:hypothetical protein